MLACGGGVRQRKREKRPEGKREAWEEERESSWG